MDEKNKLAVITRSEPQAALAAYNSGLKHKFTYHLRSVPGMEDHVKPSEDAIRNKLLPLTHRWSPLLK